MLEEDNVRQGFFEREQYESVPAHLPDDIQPVIEFAYLTGWRVPGEVLTLEWRQVDFDGAEVRLEPGTTKNKKGRTFPFTAALRTLLEECRIEHEKLKKAGHIIPNLFWRMVADERGGVKKPRAILRFEKEGKHAVKPAGCPGRIPHNLRRTAVRNLVRAGVSESVAMKLTGHKTRKVFERYNIVSDGDLREAVAKLAARHGTILGQSAPIAVNDDDRIDQFAEEMVEAPPGFEPGVEVLQTSALPLGDGAP